MTRKEWWAIWSQRPNVDGNALLEAAAELLGPQKCATLDCSETHFVEPSKRALVMPCPKCETRLRKQYR